MFTAKFTYHKGEVVNAKFTSAKPKPINAVFGSNLSTRDHNKLINRDLPDQHPINAITGLQEALDTIPDDYVSEAELEAALLEKQDVIRDLSEIRQGATLGATAVQPSELESYATKGYVDDSLSEKQDALTAGANVQIVGNIISATDTTYTAGTGISIIGNVISNTQTSAEWGNIQGNISAQTDLQNTLDNKANISDIPTKTSDLTNDSGYITNAALVGYATQTWVGQQGYITGINSSDVTTALGYTPYNSSNPSGYQTENQVANSIATETTNRENADISLQNQIDAIVASSDVFDIVGTYAELQAYDISTVPVNDIIKVLVDSTHSNAATYYRCVETGGVKSWSYIGSEGAYYTKGEADSTFVPQTRTVNNKALSSDITLTAGDVNALPDSTTINDLTTSAQQAALNSGATQTNITQIGTNATNITTINGQISTINTTLATKISKFTATNPTLTTSGGVCTWSIVNSFATNEVQVQIFRVSDGIQVMTEVDTSASTIVVKFNSSSNITAGIYRAVVQG